MTPTFNEYQSAYCRNCGQSCQPERYTRPPEDNEPWLHRKVEDWRSSCCKDELSEDPVSDRCDQCGATVWTNVPDAEVARFILADGNLLCPSCLADYRVDHPDWEAVVEELEYRQDCKEDR